MNVTDGFIEFCTEYLRKEKMPYMRFYFKDPKTRKIYGLGGDNRIFNDDIEYITFDTNRTTRVSILVDSWTHQWIDESKMIFDYSAERNSMGFNISPKLV